METKESPKAQEKLTAEPLQIMTQLCNFCPAKIYSLSFGLILLKYLLFINSQLSKAVDVAYHTLSF